jgi:hypothetical protein
MSLTVVGSVAFDALENLKYKSNFRSVITNIMTNLKSLCCLLIFSFIFANCSAAQENPSPESTTKPIESSDGVNPETKRFESKAGNFSINISQPLLMNRNVGSGKQFGWKLEKLSFTAMYSPLFDSDGSPVQQFDQMNSGVRKGTLRQGNKVISEKEISYGKHPGREFHSISPNGVKFITRNYLINDMGYQIIGVYVDEKDEKEALEVLDSFKLLSDKK